MLGPVAPYSPFCRTLLAIFIIPALLALPFN